LAAHTHIIIMTPIKSPLLEKDSNIIAEARKQNIPIEKYKEIIKEKRLSAYHKTELIKSLKFLLNINLDNDTSDINIEIVIDKLMRIVKHELKSELLKDNWKIC
jgi:hypothetical protein